MSSKGQFVLLDRKEDYGFKDRTFGMGAYSTDSGHLFRRKAATCSEDTGQGVGAKRRWVKHYTMQWAA